MVIRAETAADVNAIRRVLAAAFPGPAEARLVDQIRVDGDLVYSLVAVEEGHVVGHIAFSSMAAPFHALGLGPLAVRPEWQRRGVGARLVNAGVARATADGWQAVFLLGNPRYYERFGFSVALAAGFTSPYAGPHLMVLPLGGAPLPALTGHIEYAPAFGALES